MDKESILKSLDEIKELVNDDKKFKYKNIVNFNCKYIKEEIETIYNTNSSEALECLEKLFNEYKELCLDTGSNEHIYQECNLTSTYNTIKRYILKEQEPKQYLKWKDLDFSYRTKVLNVRMNDTIYKITYRFFDNTDEVQLLSEDEKLLYFIFVGKYKDNVQLFNDLHLEVIE